MKISDIKLPIESGYDKLVKEVQKIAPKEDLSKMVITRKSLDARRGRPLLSYLTLAIASPLRHIRMISFLYIQFSRCLLQ